MAFIYNSIRTGRCFFFRGNQTFLPLGDGLRYWYIHCILCQLIVPPPSRLFESKPAFKKTPDSRVLRYCKRSFLAQYYYFFFFFLKMKSMLCWLAELNIDRHPFYISYCTFGKKRFHLGLHLRLKCSFLCLVHGSGYSMVTQKCRCQSIFVRC